MTQMPNEIQVKMADAGYRLTYACSQIGEEFYAKQIMLSGNMLIDSMNAAMENLNPKTLGDVEFAFDDVASLVEELPESEIEWFQPPFNTIRSTIQELGFHISLPEVLTKRIRSLRDKLGDRLRAVERASFRPPGSPEEPLPHDPATLQNEADALRAELVAAGFETPLLDKLATDPASIDNLDCTTLTEELDVILG